MAIIWRAHRLGIRRQMRRNNKCQASGIRRQGSSTERQTADLRISSHRQQPRALKETGHFGYFKNRKLVTKPRETTDLRLVLNSKHPNVSEAWFPTSLKLNWNTHGCTKTDTSNKEIFVPLWVKMRNLLPGSQNVDFILYLRKFQIVCLVVTSVYDLSDINWMVVYSPAIYYRSVVDSQAASAYVSPIDSADNMKNRATFMHN